jgi:hypothetical protein
MARMPGLFLMLLLAAVLACAGCTARRVPSTPFSGEMSDTGKQFVGNDPVRLSSASPHDGPPWRYQ